MNPSQLYSTLQSELQQIVEANTFKYEVPLESEQGGRVKVGGSAKSDVVMLASNNYLGHANHPEVKEAAPRGLDKWGF
jgi:glycine C-acetyltransferase